MATVARATNPDIEVVGVQAALFPSMFAKIKGEDHKIYCLVGDGECNEGVIWEAAMNAVKREQAAFGGGKFLTI